MTSPNKIRHFTNSRNLRSTKRVVSSRKFYNQRIRKRSGPKRSRKYKEYIIGHTSL